jgi:hypothetical protein
MPFFHPKTFCFQNIFLSHFYPPIFSSSFPINHHIPFSIDAQAMEGQRKKQVQGHRRPATDRPKKLSHRR